MIVARRACHVDAMIHISRSLHADMVPRTSTAPVAADGTTTSPVPPIAAVTGRGDGCAGRSVSRPWQVIAADARVPASTIPMPTRPTARMARAGRVQRCLTARTVAVPHDRARPPRPTRRPSLRWLRLRITTLSLRHSASVPVWSVHLRRSLDLRFVTAFVTGYVDPRTPGSRAGVAAVRIRCATRTV